VYALVFPLKDYVHNLSFLKPVSSMLIRFSGIQHLHAGVSPSHVHYSSVQTLS
jgi:hypothetical protein